LVSFGQSPIQKARQALLQKDANAFVLQAHSTLNVRILSKEGVYSQAQAGQLIQSFMKDHPSTSIEIQQVQEKKGQAHFFIGEYVTARQTFRLYVLFKEINGVERVHSFEVQSND
jgi:hypothetical protein